MANKHDKHKENAPGKWYTDSNCIICGLCAEYAPTIFQPNVDNEFNYVFKQPETPQEVAQATECKEACPTDAIGNDGDAEFDAIEHVAPASIHVPEATQK